MKCLLLPLLILVGCQPDTRRPGLDEKLERIDRLVQEAHATGATAGLGVGIAVDGRTEYVANLGFTDATAGTPADDRSLWYVASTTKSFTGFGIALLAERGEIDVNAPIGTYLPDVTWPDGVDPAGLTVADFLGHTHGLGNGPLVLSAAFTGSFPESEFGRLMQYQIPGSRELTYTNLGYNVASMILAAKRPEGWKAFLQTEVYEPAGMNEFYAQVSGVNPDRIAKPHTFTSTAAHQTLPFVKQDLTMNAAGGHMGTIADLTRWAIVQMDGGRIDGKQVFPPRAVEMAHEPLRTHDRRFAYFQRDAWAMGWDIGSYEGEHMVSRFGGYNSTRSHLSFLPEHRVGVVAMVNGPLGSELTDIIAAYTYDLMLDRPNADSVAYGRLDEVRSQVSEMPARIAQFEEVQRSRLKPYPHPLPYYAGTYENDVLGAISVEHVRDTLYVRWGVLEGPSTVFDADAQALRHELLGSGSVMRFLPGEGHARAVEFNGFEVPYREDS